MDWLNYRMTLLEELAYDGEDYEHVKRFCTQNNVNEKELLYDCVAYILKKMREEKDDKEGL